MNVVEQISQGRHVSLTTFRPDGRSAATALWFVVDGGELFVLTAPDSGKVKRIRNNARVVIAPCDVPGRIAEGVPSGEGAIIPGVGGTGRFAGAAFGRGGGRDVSDRRRPFGYHRNQRRHCQGE